MAAINQTSIPLTATGGTGNPPVYQFMVLPTESTVPATVVSGILTVDATGVPPGNYAVKVSLQEGSKTTTQTIPVTVVAGDSFVIKDSSFSVAAEQLPVTKNFTLTASGGTAPYVWSLTADRPGVTISASTGQLTLPLLQYGSFSLAIKATDSAGNVANKVFNVNVVPSKPYKLVDGQIEADLYGSSIISKGTHSITAVVQDAAGTQKTMTSYFKVESPLSTLRIPSYGINQLLTKDSIGTYSLPLVGDASGFLLKGNNFQPVLGMPALFDSASKNNNIAGPPTNFGTGRLALQDPLLQGATVVGYVHRDTNYAAVAGTLSNWGVGNVVTTRPLTAGVFCQINPLKPWPNAAAWAKGSGWTVQVDPSSVLPQGLSLDSLTGIIYGTPINAAVPKSTLLYFDANSATCGSIDINWNILVSGFPATLSFPTNLTLGQKAVGTLTSLSSVPLKSCVPVFTSTPNNLNLVVSGTTVSIDCTPTTTGDFDLWLQITNQNNAVSYVYSKLNVMYQDPLTITTQSLPSILSNVPYSVQLEGHGGTGLPYTWITTGPDLPAGITLSASGLLAGSTTVPNYSQTLQFKVTDSGSNTATASFLVKISNSLEILTLTLPAMKTGAAYSTQLDARGGNGTFTWSLAAGTLPSGFNLSTAGILTGTGPASAFDGQITVQVTDGASTLAKTYRLYLNNGTGNLPITASCAPVKRGCAYQGTLQISGGVAPYSWKAGTGWQAGLHLSADNTTSSTAYILGSTTATTIPNVIITVVDSAGSTGSMVLALSSVPSLAHSYTVVADAQNRASAIPGAVVGTAYNYQLTATSCNSPLVWSLVSGSVLPAGLSMTSAGVISGTPTVASSQALGSAYTTVHVTDGFDSLDIPIPMLVLAGAAKVTTATLPPATLGQTYRQQLTATGGTGGYVFSLSTQSNPLPSGFSIESGVSSYLVSSGPVATQFNPVTIIFSVKDGGGTGNVGIDSAPLSLSCVSTVVIKTGPDLYSSTSDGYLGAFAGDPANLQTNPHNAFRFRVSGLVHLGTNTADYTAWVNQFSGTTNDAGVTIHPIVIGSDFTTVWFQVTDTTAMSGDQLVTVSISGPNLGIPATANLKIKPASRIGFDLTDINGATLSGRIVFIDKPPYNPALI